MVIELQSFGRGRMVICAANGLRGALDVPLVSTRGAMYMGEHGSFGR
jgi:hypothetical protein